MCNTVTLNLGIFVTQVHSAYVSTVRCIYAWFEPPLSQKWEASKHIIKSHVPTQVLPHSLACLMMPLHHLPFVLMVENLS